jgi:hypothetical protein
MLNKNLDSIGKCRNGLVLKSNMLQEMLNNDFKSMLSALIKTNIFEA